MDDIPKWSVRLTIEKMTKMYSMFGGKDKSKNILDIIQDCGGTMGLHNTQIYATFKNEEDLLIFILKWC
jgi:hypothetical protein